MKYIAYKDKKTDADIKLSYQDFGKGQPVVLIHGWPLSQEMWEYQLEALVTAGYRVITYDRRGFGMSCKPWDYYDYDTLAADLNALLEQLDLQKVLLTGFSMGGGEIARYCALYGTARVSKAVFISAVTPYMLQTDNNPDGVPQSEFDKIIAGLKKDRIGFLADFGKDFFGVNLVNHPISGPLLNYYLMLESVASPRATLECAASFSHTDFRQDMDKVTVPTLVIHGSADKTVPIATGGDRTSKMIANARYIVYEDEPHGLFYTAKDRLNADLIDFFQRG